MDAIKKLDNKLNKNELNIEDRYKNSGFSLIYNQNLNKIKKLDNRSLDIYHKSLKKKSIVKNYKSQK